MKNFIYHNPTELIFGKGQIARLSTLIWPWAAVR